MVLIKVILKSRLFIPAFFATLIALPVVALAAPAVVSANVNLRSGPGAKYARVTMLPVGTRIDVGGCRRNWCQVSDRTYRGWVSARYVRMGGAASWPGLCPAAFSQGHY